MPRQLTDEQFAQYQREGYVVIEDLLDEAELDQLRARLREYTHGGRPHDKLRIQIEPRVARGEVRVAEWGDGIRKIDHLVEFDDAFRKLGTHPNLVGVVEQLLGPDLKLFRNSLLLKPPEVGSPKGWHQDSPYWPIQPMDLCSCWFPLDDATPENGCMWALPGEHNRGPLPHKRVTDDFVIEEDAYDQDKATVLPMKAGSGLFFHSLLPHYTAPNRTDKWRRAIALSYMSARARHVGQTEPEYMTITGRDFPGCVQGYDPQIA
jgi:ectoine hydroxylase-related dioxygenase (phytanoyl-CoA dioxygenase family)